MSFKVGWYAWNRERRGMDTDYTIAQHKFRGSRLGLLVVRRPLRKVGTKMLLYLGHQAVTLFNH
jgi:hypothetical protein